MNRQTLGILGGMGPRSTSPFLELVLDEVQEQWQPEGEYDYPPIMILSLPAPFFLGKPLDHKAVSSAIKAGLQRLGDTGVQHIALPCNTAHLYYDALDQVLDIPLLNMIDIAIAALPETAREVAILATDWTVDAGLYQKALAESGRQAVVKPSWQQGVNRAIQAVKDGGDLRPAQADWQALLNTIGTSVSHAILACTDLNPLHITEPENLIVCDATAALAKEAIRLLDNPLHKT